MAWRVPKEQVAILKNNYDKLTVEELSELTGLNRSTIASIASREGFSLMPRGRNTPDAVKERAVAFVTENHKSMSNFLLSYHTGVSIMVIKHIKHNLGLKKLSLDDWREEMESVVEPGLTPMVCMELFQQKYPEEFRSILNHFTDNAVYCKFKRLCRTLKADDAKSDKP